MPGFVRDGFIDHRVSIFPLVDLGCFYYLAIDVLQELFTYNTDLGLGRIYQPACRSVAEVGLMVLKCHKGICAKESILSAKSRLVAIFFSSAVILAVVSAGAFL